MSTRPSFNSTPTPLDRVATLYAGQRGREGPASAHQRVAGDLCLPRSLGQAARERSPDARLCAKVGALPDRSAVRVPPP